MPQTRTPKPAPTTRPADSATAQKVVSKPAPVVDGPPAAPARLRRKGRLEVPPPPRVVAKKTTQASEKKPKSATAKAAKTKARAGLSGLDAAAKVLENLKGTESREGIVANDLIDRMQRARLWTSPGGKTPSATLYAAMTREIAAKKGEARFARVSPGRFTFKAAMKARRGGGGE